MQKSQLLILLPALLAGCAFPVSNSANPSAQASGTQQSMKGFNLFSWKDDSNNSYNYALLEATNASPDLARVRKEGSADLSSLLTRLKNLKAGESVFWNFQVSTISSLHFALPPAEVAQRIRDTASQQGLKLEVDPFFTAIASPSPAAHSH